VSTPICWRCQKPLTFRHIDGVKVSTHRCEEASIATKPGAFIPMQPVEDDDDE